MDFSRIRISEEEGEAETGGEVVDSGVDVVAEEEDGIMVPRSR